MFIIVSSSTYVFGNGKSYRVLIMNDEKNKQHILITPDGNNLQSAEQIIDYLPLPASKDDIYYMYYITENIYKKIKYNKTTQKLNCCGRVGGDLAAQLDAGRRGWLGLVGEQTT